MVENHRAVLRTDVGSLPVEAGRVVAAEEGFEQFGVGDLAGVIGHPYTLSVAGRAAAYSFVSRVFNLAPFVTRYSGFHTVEGFVHGFGAPEAAGTKGSFLKRRR